MQNQIILSLDIHLTYKYFGLLIYLQINTSNFLLGNQIV